MLIPQSEACPPEGAASAFYPGWRPWLGPGLALAWPEGKRPVKLSFLPVPRRKVSRGAAAVPPSDPGMRLRLV